MKKAFYFTAGIMVAALLLSVGVFGHPAHAVEVLGGCPANVCDKQTVFGSGSIFSNILKILTFLLGAAAVVMIIIGGFKYITANGDQSAITSAKNTILYSIIGLVVALMAGAIVTFVVDNLGK